MRGVLCRQKKCCYCLCQPRTCIITYGILTAMVLLPVTIIAPFYYSDRLADPAWVAFFALNIAMTVSMTATFIGGLCADSHCCRLSYFYSYLASIVAYIGYYVWQGLSGNDTIPSLGKNSAMKVVFMICFIVVFDGWLLSLVGSWCNAEMVNPMEIIPSKDDEMPTVHTNH